MAPPTGWLDIHGHFYPPVPPNIQHQKWQAMRDSLFLVPESATEWNPDTILSYLDTAGVQMQMLSNIPPTLPDLVASNTYGASLVKQHPTRFGLLAALPTDDPEAALEEVRRALDGDGEGEGGEGLGADGFAVTCCYKGVWLSDERLEPVWAELDKRRAVVFTHPFAYAPPHLGRPSPLIEVAFETARAVVDMLYTGIFRRYPNITFIISHAGGALPALSGRLKLLGAEPWVPNPLGITKEEIKSTLARLYVDTAASAMAEAVEPAVRMVGKAHLVYGSDCGVPCSTPRTMEENKAHLVEDGVLTQGEAQGVGRRGWEFFPRAVERVERGKAD